MNKVNHLIISNSMDFTTDYVCHELNYRKANYVRINRDNFANYQICYDVSDENLEIVIDVQKYLVNDDNLKSIYYRAPVFLRDSYQNYDLNKQLYRSQWSSFLRNLMIFKNVKWINNPSETYIAENKIIQLITAKHIGFKIPKTKITNSNNYSPDEKEFIIQSLDTAILKNNKEEEAFVYSNIISNEEFKNSNINQAPIIMHELIKPKIDLRVTVIGKRVYAAIIKNKDGNIKDDWRKQKDDLKFILFKLPKEIEIKCIELLKYFKLNFGAIDFAINNNDFYFLEINPTGEWAWLVESSGFEIYKDIVNIMLGDRIDSF